MCDFRRTAGSDKSPASDPTVPLHSLTHPCGPIVARRHPLIHKQPTTTTMVHVVLTRMAFLFYFILLCSLITLRGIPLVFIFPDNPNGDGSTPPRSFRHGWTRMGRFQAHLVRLRHGWRQTGRAFECNATRRPPRPLPSTSPGIHPTCNMMWRLTTTHKHDMTAREVEGNTGVEV